MPETFFQENSKLAYLDIAQNGNKMAGDGLFWQLPKGLFKGLTALDFLTLFQVRPCHCPRCWWTHGRVGLPLHAQFFSRQPACK